MSGIPNDVVAVLAFVKILSSCPMGDIGGSFGFVRHLTDMDAAAGSPYAWPDDCGHAG